jgi:hypothetical protein
MFFKAKERKLSQSKTHDAPRAPRYASLAMVSINGFEGCAVLRNVSIGGFRMESKTFVNMDVGNSYAIQITPETESNIGKFELHVVVQWVQSFAEKFAVGFQISQGGGRPLERYIEFLKNKRSS